MKDVWSWLSYTLIVKNEENKRNIAIKTRNVSIIGKEKNQS